MKGCGRMTLRHLRIFVAVCQEGSVTRAAEKLFLAQPAVSLAIREMEHHCGLQLFERYARKLHLTPSGSEMLNYARRILALYDEMEMSYTLNNHADVIRVGTGTALGKLFFPQFIKKFQTEHPSAQIRMYIDRTDLNASKLCNNQLDFVIMENIPEMPHIIRRSLHSSPIVGICHREHELAGKEAVTAFDLVKYPLLLREKESPTYIAVETFFFNHNIQIQPTWESISVMSLIHAVRENLGIAFISKNQISAVKNPDIKILNVVNFNALRHINLYYHKDKQFTPVMEQLIDEFATFINQIDNNSIEFQNEQNCQLLQ